MSGDFAQRPPGRGLGSRAASAIERFIHVEAASGAVLLLAAALALAWANSPYAHGYEALWHLIVPLGFGEAIPPRSLHFWINDGLMTVFFLVVGMEIRREIHEGALSNPRQAALPIVAAVGGVITPALIFLAINSGPLVSRGWAVPTATDIAFAVGVLALLGRGIPPNVRVILLTLAIVDDVIAVLIIAAFYSGGLQLAGFLVAGAAMLMVKGFHRLRIESAWAYVLPGAVMWAGMLMTGAHPALAGVVLGLMTPVVADTSGEAPVVRVRNVLHGWVAFGVMPLFALANAGVAIRASGGGDPAWVLAGVAIALVLGKPLGVMGVSWAVVRLGWCRLPPGVTWGGVALIGLLAGIGFTMSIFVAMLAYTDRVLLDAAKLGVLAGSFAAGVLGLVWGVFYVRGLRRAE